jgi:uroporphyrinogen decarboxylase
MEFANTSLTRDEVRGAIRRTGAPRPPLAFVKWWGEGLAEQYGSRLGYFDRYREDVCVVSFPVPSFSPRSDGFHWRLPQLDTAVSKAHDANAALPDWKYLADFLKTLPDTDAPGLFDAARRSAEAARSRGQYVLIHHWSLMYERIWNFRGMENLLTDYYDYPDEVHALHKAVADTELKLLRRAIDEVRPDGYMISDDLGGQNSLMMSPVQFRAFIKPYYKRIWGFARERDIDVWLHTCGHITEIIGDLIECGLSVLHPIQKHTMDWNKAAADWKGKITFLVGMDVQDTLINSTPEQVRAEVRLMRDTFDSSYGGFMYAAGNGIVAGTPFVNIDAFIDECIRYGN